ncbi:MAG: lysophospholipid acyltransferase family protein [Planctomycetia bacterium]|nr:MAG: lysophospholipid acyltransferase family protein [Planctomycetia bacterium]
MSTRVVAPFHLPEPMFASLAGAGGLLRRLIERLLHFPELNAAYADAISRDEAIPFHERALSVLGVTIRIDDESLQRIPASGPLIVVSNHPHGALDGLVLLSVLRRVRPDVRLLANYLLGIMPEMAESCIFVDPFGGTGAQSRNRGSMRDVLKWVRGGGVLGIFPAGEVSHLTLARGSISDPVWSPSIGRLASATGAAVLPVFIDGVNSRLFQWAGLMHPRLRTALLPRELLRMRNQRVAMDIGAVIPPERIAAIRGAKAPTEHATVDDDDARVVEYLRLRTYILRARSPSAVRPKATGLSSHGTPSPIAAGRSASELSAAVDALPLEWRVVESGKMRVYAMPGDASAIILDEIGRQRELTFRVVGEGTGRPIDLDRFDPHYTQLFVWDVEQARLVGAYRLGQTDVLLSRFGMGGLYTSTLFAYRRELMEQLGPSLEMGRSFVTEPYQRDYAPLLLLWKGIGAFVVRNPRYRRLFGAVSISDEFHSMTKQLLMRFLKAQRLDGALAALVRPRNPPRVTRFRDADESRLSSVVTDMAGVEELVAEIESNRRSVPVLLRQYLRLSGRLLAFNVDADFGDVIDGLILVDLVGVDRPVLQRYMGAEGMRAFLAHHGAAVS